MNETNSNSQSPLLLPRSGRLIGVDFGTVRIGLAVSDPGQRLATPLEVYRRRSLRLDANFFLELNRREQATGWVVGLPIHTSGGESQKSGEARKFAFWLQEVSQIPVVLFDERFTTAIARDLLNQTSLSGKKRKERLDKIAAQVLLAAYLEAPAQALPLAAVTDGETSPAAGFGLAIEDVDPNQDRPA